MSDVEEGLVTGGVDSDGCESGVTALEVDGEIEAAGGAGS